MRNLAMFLVLSSTVVTAVACRDDEEPAAKPRSMAATPVPRRVPQIAPPIDVAAPPSDAAKTASGVSYKRLVANNLGAQVKGNETALVRYTGWRQGTGETHRQSDKSGVISIG